MGIDKLKENSLINTTFYLFGSTFATILGEQKYSLIKSLNETNRIYKLLYSGVVLGIHPYKLKRVLSPATDCPVLYKDYLLPIGSKGASNGLHFKESYHTAIKQYEKV